MNSPGRQRRTRLPPSEGRAPSDELLGAYQYVYFFFLLQNENRREILGRWGPSLSYMYDFV
jgi:hypothetical protein